MHQGQQPTGQKPADSGRGGGILGFAQELGQVFGKYLGRLDSPKERREIIDGICSDASLQTESDAGSK